MSIRITRMPEDAHALALGRNTLSSDTLFFRPEKDQHLLISGRRESGKSYCARALAFYAITRHFDVIVAGSLTSLADFSMLRPWLHRPLPTTSAQVRTYLTEAGTRTHKAPVLLVVDDVENLDGDSSRALQHLLRIRTRPRIHVVLTYTDTAHPVTTGILWSANMHDSARVHLSSPTNALFNTVVPFEPLPYVSPEEMAHHLHTCGYPTKEETA